MTRMRWGWLLKVSLMFLVGRAISTVMLLVLASQQAANAWTGDQPTLWDFSSMWDGRWYNIIAEVGYPSELPYTDDGHVAENAWAFLPVYPLVVRSLMTLSGLPWNISAVIVSLACAYLATLFLYKLLVRFVPAQQALFAVLLFSVAPVSPLFQLAYAESLQMLLIVVALYLLVQRKYAWMIPVILVLSATRPGSLAIALTLVLHWLYRAFSRGRFPMREKVLVGFVAGLAAISGMAWMWIAGWVTSVPSAYLDTELAWRAAYIGYHELVPFTPWIHAAHWWTTSFGYPELAGYLLLAVLVVGFGIFLLLPATKKLGVDIRFYLLSYALYVLAVFFPQSSTFRILAPLFPALGALAAPRSRIYRVGMVILFIALQWGWLLICWRIDGYDWSPP